MALTIYLLTRRDGEDIHYDEAYGFVVAAGSPPAARKLVATARERDEEGPGDEGSDTWLDTSRSRIKALGTASDHVKPGVIMRDYNAG